jgi:DNA-binding response OmpR family regulator
MKTFIFVDDPDEGDILKSILAYAGFDVSTSTTPKHILENWPQNPAEIILLASDNTTMMEHISDVRQVTQVPLLVITNPISEKHLCASLKTGADLVLERPVAPRVLAAYMQVLLKRSEAVPSRVLLSLELDEITLDPATRTVTITGQEPRRLTHLEFRLLYVLMTNREQVIPMEVIVDRVWGYDDEGNRELVRGLVSRLRRKLDLDAEQSRFIENIPGVGYRFSVEDL